MIETKRISWLFSQRSLTHDVEPGVNPHEQQGQDSDNSEDCDRRGVKLAEAGQRGSIRRLREGKGPDLLDGGRDAELGDET